MCKFVENCFLICRRLLFSCLNLYLKKKKCALTLNYYTTYVLKTIYLVGRKYLIRQKVLLMDVLFKLLLMYFIAYQKLVKSIC